jgi:uncharacterized protein (TIGR03086 family)
MSENLRWYTKALYGFDHVVRLARSGDWMKPSPCEGWTALHVLGHTIAVQRYIESCVNGSQPTMDPMTDPDRHAGADPAQTWAATRDSLLASLDHEGVIHRVVKTFRGEEEVDSMIGTNAIETTVHSWDLARALGVDDRLDPGLVSRAIELVAPRADGMRNPMLYGPRVEVGPDADPQTVLLATVGRAV